MELTIDIGQNMTYLLWAALLMIGFFTYAILSDG